MVKANEMCSESNGQLSKEVQNIERIGHKLNTFKGDKHEMSAQHTLFI